MKLPETYLNAQQWQATDRCACCATNHDKGCTHWTASHVKAATHLLRREPGKAAATEGAPTQSGATASTAPKPSWGRRYRHCLLHQHALASLPLGHGILQPAVRQASRRGHLQVRKHPAAHCSVLSWTASDIQYLVHAIFSLRVLKAAGSQKGSIASWAV
jgi:hypothetical protein